MRRTRTILVVEDDESIREMLGIALEAEGHDVVLASDGEVALEVVSRADPDLILLDLKMPRVNGWEFARRYRRTPNPAPFIVVTAAHDASQAASDIGAVMAIVKPFDLDTLLRIVDDVTRRADA